MARPAVCLCVEHMNGINNLMDRIQEAITFEDICCAAEVTYLFAYKLNNVRTIANQNKLFICLLKY